MKKWKKIILTGLCMALCMTGCGSEKPRADVNARIGSLKGPTTLGLLYMMEQAGEEREAAGADFTMVMDGADFTIGTAADELMALFVKGELDIALLPANMAAVLYQRTEGELAVIDVNTLGVLYVVSDDTSIRALEDLKGRTVYLTGKGTTPDYVLRYLLEQAGILEDVELEYRSEATEVAVLLAEQAGGTGLLPQPFASVACGQNDRLETVLDLTREWQNVQGENGSRLVTGVTVVRRAFLEEHPEAVEAFLDAHKESANYAADHVEETAALAVRQGIIANEQAAVSAIPKCNIVYMEGEEMKQALAGYLKVLYEQDPESVGGSLPGDDFYYSR